MFKTPVEQRAETWASLGIGQDVAEEIAAEQNDEMARCILALLSAAALASSHASALTERAVARDAKYTQATSNTVDFISLGSWLGRDESLTKTPARCG